MQKFIPIALLAILAIGCKGGDTTASTGGGSGSPSADKTYTFKLNPKEGDKFNYKVDADAGPGQKMELDMSMVCDKVENDQYTITMAVEGGKMNGEALPAVLLDGMKKAKTTMVMDSSGKVLSSKSEGGSSQNFGVSLPSKPVKVGDEWEGTSGSGQKEVKGKFKFAKVETIDGKEIATFEVTPEKAGDEGIEGPIVTTVEVSNGMIYGVSMKGKDAKGVAQTLTMKRL